MLRNIKAMDHEMFRNYLCQLREPGTMADFFNQENVSILNLKIPKQKILQILCIPVAIWKISKFIKQNNIDIIHTNNTFQGLRYGCMASFFCSVPIVNTIHTMFLKSYKSKWSYIFRRLTAPLISRVITVSASARQQWETYLNKTGIPNDRISIVKPGLNLAQFPASVNEQESLNLRRQLNISEAAPVLMTVARIHQGKGLHLLIPLMSETIKHWKKAKLIVIGDGDYRTVFEQLIKEAGLENAIFLLGSRDDVPQLLALSDLFVFPSLNEGFGLAVLEAMAAGKPVVAFSLPPFKEFVEDGKSGILVKPGEGGALIKAVIEALRDTDKLKKMGKRGREIVEQDFSSNISIEAIEGIYLSVAKERNAEEVINLT